MRVILNERLIINYGNHIAMASPWDETETPAMPLHSLILIIYYTLLREPASRF